MTADFGHIPENLDPEEIDRLVNEADPHYQMDSQTRRAIEAIVSYEFASERADYEREGQPEGHIFAQLRIVDAWIKETEGRDLLRARLAEVEAENERLRGAG